MADVHADLGKAFKQRFDDLLSADKYASARTLGRDAYRANEAFDAGEGLGRRAVPFEALEAGRKAQPPHLPNMARSYPQFTGGPDEQGDKPEADSRVH